MYASTLKFIKNQIHNEQIYVNERARERRNEQKARNQSTHTKTQQHIDRERERARESVCKSNTNVHSFNAIFPSIQDTAMRTAVLITKMQH